MAPPDGGTAPSKYTYDSIPDVEKDGTEESTPVVSKKEKNTYDLSFPFQLMSATVWVSMTIWGLWIAIFYGKAALYDGNLFNTVDPDMYEPEKDPWSTFAVCFHLVGAAYVSFFSWNYEAKATSG